MSISPTFYEQIFSVKVFCEAFFYLKFGFVNFWQKNIGAKAACKMLVQLTTGPLPWVRPLLHAHGSLERHLLRRLRATQETELFIIVTSSLIKDLSYFSEQLK